MGSLELWLELTEARRAAPSVALVLQQVVVSVASPAPVSMALGLEVVVLAVVADAIPEEVRDPPRCPCYCWDAAAVPLAQVVATMAER